eukprot:TRINITY_DN34968_c0_g1_i1.p1 TRINITY_DN34968_c0_g1~~TRINITY_DN34968_c0_g1_i1.p1  ORF type:complete len:394 (+),score=55.48 TRINITY_DN34968_c0_g1_i1:66-1247(+)
MASKTRLLHCQSCRGDSKDKKAADYYCPECAWYKGLPPTFCEGCMRRMHFPGTRFEFHSVEEIDHEHEAVRILSPLIPELLFMSQVLAVFHSASNMLDTYTHGRSLCPTVDFSRGYAMHADAGLFYVLKGWFASVCDSEDSFWRLFIDAWTRNVVTDSDSFLLLLLTLKRAILFDASIVFLVAPLLAFIYALFSTMVLRVELAFIPDTALTRNIEGAVNKMCILQKIAHGRLRRAPPQTRPRMRASRHIIDSAVYNLKRLLRTVMFQVARAGSMLNALLFSTLMAAVLFRVACIVFGGYRFFHDALGLGSAPGLQALAGQRVSDHVFEEVLGFLGGKSMAILPSLVTAVIPSVVMLSIPLAALGYKCMQQQKSFTHDWEAGEREKCLKLASDD